LLITPHPIETPLLPKFKGGLKFLNPKILSMIRLVVMIPAYNEEKSIANVIKNIPRSISGFNRVEVIVINDGSSDRTVSVARNAGADKIVSHDSNKGVGAAFRTGVDAALRMGADVLVNIDADGQFNPKDIPKLVKPILEREAEMVAASRFMDKGFFPEMPLYKMIGNMFFTKIISMLTGNGFTDTQCGFRAYSKEAMLNLTLFGDFTYTQEAFLDLKRKRMRIKEIPIKVTYKNIRESKVVKSPFGYLLRSGGIIIRTVRDFAPLKFFGMFGVVMLGLGSISGSYILVHWLRTGMVSPHVPLTVLTAIMLIFGVQLIILALMAEMSGRNRELIEKSLYMERKREYANR